MLALKLRLQGTPGILSLKEVLYLRCSVLSTRSRPEVAIKSAVLNRFADVLGLYLLLTLQICERSAYF
jgi:hypothetical protein